MKKIIVALSLALFWPKWGMAQTNPEPLPTPPPQSISDQFSTQILSHAVGATEFTSEGTMKEVTLLAPFQIGHYKNDYIIAQDDGLVNNSVNPDRVAGSFGIHIHVISLIRNLMTDSTILDGIDATPRISWDTDVHKFVYSYMVGFTANFGGASVK